MSSHHCSVTLCRRITIPDQLRLERYQRAPELAPSLLFFSGGSALLPLSRVLKRYSHNSIHLVTPFDSGGSSATLRQAFNMPSIGDLRSRLMALADDTITGHPEVYRLFNHRFATTDSDKRLHRELKRLIDGRNPLIHSISNPMRRLIRNQLGFFYEAMPAQFKLQGASIGNLILTGGYLNNHRHLEPIIFLFSKLVAARGTVKATVSDHLHLAATLADGSRVIGQHQLTGKEAPPLRSPIETLSLVHPHHPTQEASCKISKRTRKLIQSAELICYPPGSFYSSLIANLLPEGVGATLAASPSPKIYIPNLGADPEQIGLSLNDQVTLLLHYLRRGLPHSITNHQLLNTVLIDSERGSYGSHLSTNLMRKYGIQMIDTRLISRKSAPYYDPERLTRALLSLV
ncbi:GAK system CofD-like protein [Ectothiorhodospiraceae bacterium BW-2]|nr:GAK system CofD-like protein [Ectothiorhodospiraceae bacterium BW-2]